MHFAKIKSFGNGQCCWQFWVTLYWHLAISDHYLITLVFWLLINNCLEKMYDIRNEWTIKKGIRLFFFFTIQCKYFNFLKFLVANVSLMPQNLSSGWWVHRRGSIGTLNFNQITIHNRWPCKYLMRRSNGENYLGLHTCTQTHVHSDTKKEKTTGPGEADNHHHYPHPKKM